MQVTALCKYPTPVTVSVNLPSASWSLQRAMTELLAPALSLSAADLRRCNVVLVSVGRDAAVLWQPSGSSGSVKAMSKLAASKARGSDDSDGGSDSEDEEKTRADAVLTSDANGDDDDDKTENEFDLDKTLEALGVVDGATLVFDAPADMKPRFRVRGYGSDDDSDSDGDGSSGGKGKKKKKKKGKKNGGKGRYAGFKIKTICSKLPKLEGKQRKLGMEFFDIYAFDITMTKGFLKLDESMLDLLLRRNTLNIKEVSLFLALLRWGRAKYVRDNGGQTQQSADNDDDDDGESKQSESGEPVVSPGDLRKTIDPLLKHIRFPCMSTQDVATLVTPMSILNNDEVLAIFTYLGSKASSSASAMASSVTGLKWSTEPRQGRRPPHWFKFSDNRKGANVIIEEDGEVVTTNGTGSWCTVGADIALEDGVHEWNIMLEQYNTSNSYNVVVGVVPENFDYNIQNPLGYTKPGYGLITGVSKICSMRNSNQAYAANNARAGQGDVVNVRLDMDAKTLEFGINGEWKGVAYRGITDTSLVPAVSMVNLQKCRVEFPALASK